MDARAITAFWERVDRAGDAECWPWKMATDRDGYGVWSAYKTGIFGRGPRQWRANRIALGIKLGREPVGMACHTCDNRICCNPSHLYEGDAKTNQEDVDARGRRPDQSLIQSAETIAAILAAADAGRTYVEIGRSFNVSDSVVSHICRKRGAPPRITSNRARLTDLDHVLMADALEEGANGAVLGQLFGVNGGHALNVARRALARRKAA